MGLSCWLPAETAVIIIVRNKEKHKDVHDFGHGGRRINNNTIFIKDGIISLLTSFRS